MSAPRARLPDRQAYASAAEFGIPAGVRPLAVVAVGSLGDYATADERIVERDSRPRERLPLDEVAFAGRWGRPLSS